jgi:S-formylglutathione hydrolase FrmB
VWPRKKLSPTEPGRIVRLSLESDALRGNRLGDRHVREVPVYLPPGYDESNKPLPTAYYLAGFLGSGFSQLNWKPFAESLPQRLDRLIAEGRIGPLIVVFPDCFTRLGGSQYIDSTVCGDYAQYLTREVVPLVDASFRTASGRDHRAVLGKSSGGFGAIVHAMLYPDTWGAFACHSGDSYFEFCFLTDLPRTCTEIARHGSVRSFLEVLARKPKRTSVESHALMHLAMAACFDPLPEHLDGFQLPCDLHTGALFPERWERWLAWDPVRMIPDHADALRSMKAAFVDCGSRDQYHLHYGARQMKAALEGIGVKPTYSEFADNHSSIDYRMDVSLPVLIKAISKGI